MSRSTSPVENFGFGFSFAALEVGDLVPSLPPPYVDMSRRVNKSATAAAGMNLEKREGIVIV